MTWLMLTAIAVAPRVAMLLTVERRLDADESIVGLMAKHIANGGRVPFFFYGQDYGGGHVIEALMAVIPYRLFGPTEWGVHLAPMIFSTATVLLVYAYLRRPYGSRLAFAAAALVAVSTQYLKSSLKSDGYIETIFLGVVALWLLQGFEIAYRETARGRQTWIAAAMGATLGLALWSYDFAGVYAAAVVVFAMRRGLLHPARLGSFTAGFLVGATPLIIVNITNRYAHLRHLAGGGPGEAGITGAGSRLAALFSQQLPAFFTPDCVHNFVLPVPWYAWCTAAGLAVSVLVLAGYWRRAPGAPALAALLTLAAYLFSGYAGRSPRYLLPLEPFLSTAPALAASFLYSARRHSANLLAALIISLLSIGLVAGNVALFRDNSIPEGNVKTDPESLVESARFLEKNDVKCVKTTYFIKWRLLFLTNERVNAIDIKAHERENAFLLYEKIGCPPGTEPGYVFHNSSRYRYIFAAEMNRSGLPFKILYTKDHITAIPLPKNRQTPLNH